MHVHYDIAMLGLSTTGLETTRWDGQDVAGIVYYAGFWGGYKLYLYVSNTWANTSTLHGSYWDLG